MKNASIKKSKVFFIALLILLLFLFVFALCACDRASVREVKALSLSYKEKVVPYGTNRQDALADLEIYLGDVSVPLSDVSFEGEYDPHASARYVITVRYGTFSATLHLFVLQKREEGPNEFKRLDNIANDYYDSERLPSKGNVEVAVIPIGFADRSYDGVSDVLEKAFNGTEEETGWNSLRTFYEKTSYGKLHLHATIFPTYETGVEWNENEDFLSYQRIIGDAFSFGGYNFDPRFDSDSDGFLDCVYFIYLAPWRESEERTPWWAYTDRGIQTMQIVMEEEMEPLPQLGACVWMSIEFFDKSYSEIFEGTERKISTGVLIHETGHALGLPDYYDLNGYYPGVGSLNMMGGMNGDHDPFSKALLDWTDPIFVSGAEQVIELSSFAENGTTVFLTRSRNATLFDEAFVLCFYTPTGVCAKDAGKQGVFSKPGVLIYHISAELQARGNGSIPNIFLHSNKEPPFLIRVCEADENNSIQRSGLTSDGDLFTAGITFSPKWNDGTASGFKIHVLSLSDSHAIVSIMMD